MGAPAPRVRYNAKARGSVPGTSGKRGKIKKSQQPAQLSESEELAHLRNNGNEYEHVEEDVAMSAAPTVHDDKEAQRKEKKAAIKQELIAAAESKMTSKRKRKLDSYIEKKLKKEERVVLFQKLALSQDQVTPQVLHSSASLGSGKIQTNATRLAKDEDKLVRRALDGNGRSRKRRRLVESSGQGDDDDSSEDDQVLGVEERPLQPPASSSKPALGSALRKATDKSASSENQEPKIALVETAAVSEAASSNIKKSSITVDVGSALKRNPDGSLVAPVIVQRRRKKPLKLAFRGRGRISKNNASELTGDDDSDEEEDSIDSSESSEADSEEEIGVDNGREGEEDDEENPSQESSDSSEEGSDDDESQPERPHHDFKSWARRQIEMSKGVDPTPDYEESSPVTLAEDLFSLSAAAALEKAKARENGTLIESHEPQMLRGPLGEEFRLPKTSFAAALQESSATPDAKNTSSPVASTSQPSKASVHVVVERRPDIQASRLLLPVIAEEQNIVEAIRLNPVVIICGETGSGKTTQIPQFLYEAGFGSPGSENPGIIGITQPRRVAAMSMASRVAAELSLPPSRVSYQIRYDATVSPSTSIKFMTDGVLLRELSTDFLLNKYSVIIVDEAHERSMNTDILIGVLSRVLKLREDLWKKDKTGAAKPLRLIVMSATLRVSDFSENKTLFSAVPPIVNISSRQHPVTVHFSRRTSSDYVTESVRKTTKIHSRLPPGGILIFLTGQNEIHTVCRKLENKFGVKALEQRKKARNLGVKYSNLVGRDARPHQDEPTDRTRPIADEAEGLTFDIDPIEVDAELDGEAEADPDGFDTDDDNEEDDPLDSVESDVPMHIVPLYSLLSSEKQMKVFQSPPEGCRLVVVATNVAETSLTIPGIRYVVDCGRAKQREHDTQSGIQNFKVTWISKASASQRAGRAGRTGPGHCYRLFSSALYENHFPQFSEPEILRVPIEGVVLQMKSMHIDAVVNFPFPTPPDRIALRKAETILTHLGALEPTNDKKTKSISETPVATVGGRITDLGKVMSLFPVSPRFSKMLVAGRQHGALPYVIAIVAALSIGNPFLQETFLHNEDGDDEDENNGIEQEQKDVPELAFIKSADIRAKELRKLERRKFFASQQVHSQLGQGVSDVFRTLSVVGAYEYAGGGAKFCSEHFVRLKTMEEIHKLRAQITSIVRSNFPEADSGFSPTLPPPTSKQLKILRQLLTAGFIDQVAVRKDILSKNPSGTKYASCRGVAYQALNVDEDVFIHPSSVLFHGAPPDYVVYQDIVRTSRVWIKSVSVINPSWLTTLGRSLCTFSKVKDVPASLKGGGTVVIPKFGGKISLPPMKI